MALRDFMRIAALSPLIHYCLDVAVLDKVLTMILSRYKGFGTAVSLGMS